MTLNVRRVFRHPVFWILIVVILAAAVFGAMRARGPQVSTVTTLREDLEQHVVASGRVWVPVRVQVSTQTSGLVVRVAVLEGQRVKSGDLLVQLDDAEAHAAKSQAQAAVAEASARVVQQRRVGAVLATEGLRQARTDVERAQTDLDRTKQLAASGALAQIDVDNVRRALDDSRGQKNSATVKQRSSAPQGADSRIVVTALRQAEAQLETAEVRLAQTKIVAFQDAIVLTRSVEPGDVVQPSRTLLVLAAGEDTAQLVFQSDERNLASIRLGQTARVSADAYPTHVFDAVVSYIAPAVDPERGSIEVRLSLPAAPTFLKPDMTVSIDLTVATKKQILTLPSEAVHGLSSPTPWLLTVEDNRLVRREVTVGIRGGGSVEILSKLDEDVDVVLPDSQILTAGQRVRAVRNGG